MTTTDSRRFILLHSRVKETLYFEVDNLSLALGEVTSYSKAKNGVKEYEAELIPRKEIIDIRSGTIDFDGFQEYLNGCLDVVRHLS